MCLAAFVTEVAMGELKEGTDRVGIASSYLQKSEGTLQIQIEIATFESFTTAFSF